MALKKKDEPVVKKFVQRFEPRNDGALPVDGARPPSNGSASLPGAAGNSALTPLAQRKAVKISTVSHTLDAEVAERLRHFAFRERISESAVIEFALRGLFVDGDDHDLGQRLRDAGAALRRRS